VLDEAAATARPLFDAEGAPTFQPLEFLGLLPRLERGMGNGDDSFPDGRGGAARGRQAMLILRCPYCGVLADETELAPGGEAHLTRQGPGSDDAAFADYLFTRTNPRGPHVERWRHAFGCGKWFHAVRDTATLEVFGTYPAQTAEPPADIVAAIRARRPGQEGRA
jgi:sarcosine oxidase, subunit delta